MIWDSLVQSPPQTICRLNTATSLTVSRPKSSNVRINVGTKDLAYVGPCDGEKKMHVWTEIKCNVLCVFSF